MIDGLTRGETATDTGLTHWNTLGGWSVTVTIVRTIVVRLTFANDHCDFPFESNKTKEKEKDKQELVVC